MAHHARRGGEVGANGSHYKGGQFVNDSGVEERRAKRERERYLSLGQEVAPGVRELPPSADVRSIFLRLSGVCPFNRLAHGFGPVPEAYAAFLADRHGSAAVAELEDLRARYNRGDRWA